MRLQERAGALVAAVRTDRDLRRAWLCGVVAGMLWSAVAAIQAREKNWAWLPAAGLVIPGAVVLVVVTRWGRRNAKHVALTLRAVVVTAIAVASLVAAADLTFAVSLLLACVGLALGIWVAEATVHSTADRAARERDHETQATLAEISSAVQRQALAVERETRRRRPRVAGERRTTTLTDP